MKTKHLIARSPWLRAFATFSLQSATARAQGMVFTYRCRLNSGGNSVNGSYDLTFSVLNTGTSSYNANSATTTNSTVSNQVAD